METSENAGDNAEDVDVRLIILCGIRQKENMMGADRHNDRS